MRRYMVVEKPLFLKGGILELTRKQAAPREHLLKHIKGDRYEVAGEVCFKIGEEIGFDGSTKGYTGLIPREAQKAEDAKAEAGTQKAAEAAKKPKAKGSGKKKAAAKAASVQDGVSIGDDVVTKDD